MATPKPELKTTRVKLDSLEQWPGNARRGVVAGVKESMRVNGVFQPLIVQKSTNRIIAGNHRWLALCELHEEDPEAFDDGVDVVMIDVNDARASKMNLADNKTSDDASWDNQALLDQLLAVQSEEGGLIGTGFADDDLDDLQVILETADDVEFGFGDDVDDVGAQGEQDNGVTADGTHKNNEQRIMILTLPIANYVWLDEQLIELSEEYGTDSNSATIIRAIEALTGNEAPSHEDPAVEADEDDEEEVDVDQA